MARNEYEQKTLERMSEAIDAFCSYDSNFNDDGTISERGTRWLVGLLEKSVAEVGKKGTPPHLSKKEDVRGVLIAHRILRAI